MTLPIQVQRAAEEVAQIEQALQAQAQPSAPAPEPEPPAPEPVVDVAPAPAPAAPVPPPPPAEDFEHKYRTLQGTFNSLVPKLQQQIREMQGEVESLKKAKAPADPPKPEADPKDSETFGADVVDMVVRTTKGIVMPVVTDLQARLAKLEQLAESLTQSSSATAEDVFFDRLQRAVPDWQDINVDPRFIEWLKEVDPVFKQPRSLALTHARNALDADGVISVFTVFKKSIQPPAAPAQAPAPKPSLEQQVVPGTGGHGHAPAAPQAKPIITQREVHEFYNSLAQGKWRGREAAAAAREAEINLAAAEGRLR